MNASISSCCQQYQALSVLRHVVVLCIENAIVDVVPELVKNAEHRVERFAGIVSKQSLDVLAYRYLRSDLLDAASKLEEHRPAHVIETETVTSVAECLTWEASLNDINSISVIIISHICDVTSDYVAYI